MVLPLSFLLTINNLRLRCGTKWYGVVKTGKSWEREAENEEPVGNRPKSTTNSPNRPKLTRFCIVLPSSLGVAVADKDARQACDLIARKERRRFARRPQGPPAASGRTTA